MNLLLIVAGILAGLGCWLLISEFLPAGPSLRAAIERLGGEATTAGPPRPVRIRAASSFSRAVPWLPEPSADLRLLGQDPADWWAAKLGLCILGLALVPALTGLLALGGKTFPLTCRWPARSCSARQCSSRPIWSRRVNAAEKRSRFPARADQLPGPGGAGARRRCGTDGGAGGSRRGRRRLGVRADQSRAGPGPQGKPAALGRAGQPGGGHRHH